MEAWAVGGGCSDQNFTNDPDHVTQLGQRGALPLKLSAEVATPLCSSRIAEHHKFDGSTLNLTFFNTTYQERNQPPKWSRRERTSIYTSHMVVNGRGPSLRSVWAHS